MKVSLDKFLFNSHILSLTKNVFEMSLLVNAKNFVEALTNRNGSVKSFQNSRKRYIFISSIHYFFFPLTVLARKNCILLNSVQEFIEIEAWLLLTFFICLHNQILSILLAHIKQNRCLGKMTKHERLLLSACFTPKFELAFVLIEENASS